MLSVEFEGAYLITSELETLFTVRNDRRTLLDYNSDSEDRGMRKQMDSQPSREGERVLI